MRPDLYIAADIEADGPLPGPNSMLSLGLCAAGRFDGETFTAFPARQHTFYREIKPISDRYDPKALEVSGLDRQRLAEEGEEPAQALTEAHQWVCELAGEARPVMVSWPLAYDWLFLQWYFLRFSAAGSPFGFSSAIDIKTLFWRGARTVLDGAGLDDLPPELQTDAEHTHNALDDAARAAELFVRLWDYPRVRERAGA